MHSVVVRDVSRAEVIASSSGAAVLQGPPRGGGPRVAQNPKLGALLEKEEWR